ncbi:hypothetical protein Bca4012_017888 [Brassica carinata]
MVEKARRSWGRNQIISETHIENVDEATIVITKKAMKQRRDLAYIIKVGEDETNMEGDKKPQNLDFTVGIRVKTENYKQDGQKGGTDSGVTLEKREENHV